MVENTQGEYKNGEENGFGEWSDLDGQTYICEFKDGEFDGLSLIHISEPTRNV